MRVVFGIVALLVSGSAVANNDALLEACNAMQDPTRRLECFKQATAKATTPAPAAVVHHAALRDALIALDGQLNQGISLNNYNQAILVPAREMALFESKVNPAEHSEAIGALRAAMQAYSDAGRFWNASISAGARNRGPFTSSSVITYDDMTLYGVGDLVGKYSMPTRSAGPFGALSGVSRYDGVSTIWAVARKNYQEAFRILDGKPTPAASKASTPEDGDVPTRYNTYCETDVIERVRQSVSSNAEIFQFCGRR